MDLLIDVGSTNIKFQCNGEAGSVPFPAPKRCDGLFYEVDREKIFAEIIQIVERFRAERIFFSVQMHGYLLARGVRFVTDYISWRDKRGEGKTPAFSLTPAYGVHIKPNLPRLSLQTYKETADEFFTLGSYLVYRLTGVNASHITDLAPSGFYNVATRCADGAVYKLPRAHYEVQKIGNYRSSAVYSPVGDQQAAVFGAEKEDCYILNLGTAGQMCTVSEDFVSGAFESRPYFGGRTLCTVTGIAGGAAIGAFTGSEKALENFLYAEYRSAAAKLPERENIIVCGGVARYREGLLVGVLERLNLPYEFYKESDALRGLQKIAERTK